MYLFSCNNILTYFVFIIYILQKSYSYFYYNGFDLLRFCFDLIALINKSLFILNNMFMTYVFNVICYQANKIWFDYL